MSPSKSGGISKPNASDSAKGKERLRDATDANLSAEKARSANEQASIVTKAPENRSASGQGQSVHTQSKPEANAMEDINYEPLGKPIGEPQPHSNIPHASGNPSSISTDGVISLAGPPHISTAELSGPEPEAELLADFNSLSLPSGSSGVVDGFGGRGTAAFCILREGPRYAPLYHFRRTNGFNATGLKNLSYHRITLLTYENDRGEMNRLYTKKNVDGIVGVAVEEGKAEGDRSPQTWIKIKWNGIKPEHKGLLIEVSPGDISMRHSSWITKSDLVKLVGRKAAIAKIRESWSNQQQRHLRHLENSGSMIDRSPTPCPLDIFEEKREQRRKSRSYSPAYYETLGPESSGPRSHTQPPETVIDIKEEPEDDTRVVPPAPPATQSHPLNTADQRTEQGQDQPPRWFSFDTFLEEVKKREKWHLLSQGEVQKKFAAAEARYPDYSEAKKNLGYTEKED